VEIELYTAEGRWNKNNYKV